MLVPGDQKLPFPYVLVWHSACIAFYTGITIAPDKGNNAGSALKCEDWYMWAYLNIDHNVWINTVYISHSLLEVQKALPI